MRNLNTRKSGQDIGKARLLQGTQLNLRGVMVFPAPNMFVTPAHTTPISILPIPLLHLGLKLRFM
ncbi:unnamed protein product [Brassica oleracea var. botrytis]|uniref:(rape) hypothetical protein n=1 Tax=Brassica napus TaxID=3708 RepID=A0A816UE27_BRANA|nr:unnamed protein product [Brassica napus]